MELTKQDYTGSKSTFCAGCGHDQIANHIISACFQAGIEPKDIFKMSGIGCSSKMPAYFLGKSYGVNSLHGRMAPVATGAKVASHNKIVIGVSGDGDTTSIGMGGFIHMIRKNLPICYMIANNGVYGLTKGQFSPTSDAGAQLKHGETNPFDSIDICSLAMDVGATFVARSFSGDSKQLVPLLQAALRHRGTAVIDILSPCVTFNNHDGSTKSFSYVREHDRVLQELGFFSEDMEPPAIESENGQQQVVTLVDGSKLVLKKLEEGSHDVYSKLDAYKTLKEAREKGEIVTGLFYVNERIPTLIDKLNLPERKALTDLQVEELRPSRELFDTFIHDPTFFA